ncbi:Hypothetical protein D9617_1g082250 [Elsinoe fawcettii]|nr:Hypothetical protein D9617_1g082250 [Elsinoe fawcettii]
MDVVETITAATVFEIFDESTNSTTRTTEYAELPSDYTLPVTASDGRHMASYYLTGYTTDERNVTKKVTTSTVTVTYPELYLSFSTSITFDGEIPTTNAAGSSVCLREPDGAATLQLMTTSTRAYVPSTTTDPNDPLGYQYTFITGIYGIDGMGSDQFSSYIWPDENVFKVCNIYTEPYMPAILQTAAFLTVTSSRRVASMTEPRLPEPMPAPGSGGPPQSRPEPVFAVRPPESSQIAPKPAPGITQGPVQTAVPIGGFTFTPIASNVAKAPDGQTLSLGNTAIIGPADKPTPVVLTTNSAGMPVLVAGDSRTFALSAPGVKLPEGLVQPIVVGSQTLSRTSGTLLLAPDGKPLQMGATAFVGSGPGQTAVVLTTDKAGSSVLVVGGTSTISIPASATAPIVVAGQTLIPTSASYLTLPDGQILRMGGTVVIESGQGSSRTSVLMTTNAAGQSILVVGGSSTITLPAPTSNDVADSIMKGIGGAIGANNGNGQGSRAATSAASTKSATASSPVQFTGSGSAFAEPIKIQGCTLALVVLALAIFL